MKTLSTILVLAFTACFTFACSAGIPKSTGKPITHEDFTQLLQKHVDKDGHVNYAGFVKDSVALKVYLNKLEKNYPNDKNWSSDESKAFWINAYNAFTIKLVADNYPVESIKDIGPKVSLPFVNSVWDIKFINFGGEEVDLNYIEHKILRKDYDDPRIHFAINCASESCPKLINEAYEANRVEKQLEERAVDFINDEKRNQPSEMNPKMSKIFTWFKGDFTKKGDLIDYWNKYSKVTISSDAKIDYLDYGWGLNK